MVNKNISQKTVNFLVLPREFSLYANPMILMMNMKGGKRAEAGQWFLEIQKLLHGIEESVIGLENFMNQTAMNKKVSVDGHEITLSEEKKYWMFTYLIDNAVLRIFAGMDKLAQMVRVYYEHKDKGGLLEVIPPTKCKCGLRETMGEKNCTFGNLMNYLHRFPRKEEIDGVLGTLDRNTAINNLRPYRSGFVHRKNRLDQSMGLDPDVKPEYKSDGSVETLFSFGGGLPTINWFRIEIVNAHNAIIECLMKINPIIFPRDFTLNITIKDKNEKAV